MPAHQILLDFITRTIEIGNYKPIISLVNVQELIFRNSGTRHGESEIVKELIRVTSFMEFSAMKKVSAFQSVIILPKASRLFLSEDGADVAVPMQASTQRRSVDSCQGDMYTAARNIRIMVLQPYESGVLNPVGKLHGLKFEQRGYRSRKQLNK
jgi:hypothetical protein